MERIEYLENKKGEFREKRQFMARQMNYKKEGLMRNFEV